MSVARTLLLKVSDNHWLRANGTRVPFIRRAVAKFMPGEAFEDMIAAARTTAGEGIAAVFTRLGENVKDLGEADDVATHYLAGIDRIRELGLSCEPSIKVTQLGLDIDDRCRRDAELREQSGRDGEQPFREDRIERAQSGCAFAGGSGRGIADRRIGIADLGGLETAFAGQGMAPELVEQVGFQEIVDEAVFRQHRPLAPLTAPALDAVAGCCQHSTNLRCNRGNPNEHRRSQRPGPPAD